MDAGTSGTSANSIAVNFQPASPSYVTVLTEDSDGNSVDLDGGDGFNLRVDC